MGQSGNWIPNLVNWLLGEVIIYIWSILAIYFFNWFMMWQVSLEGMIKVYEGFRPKDLTTLYEATMAVGNGGTYQSTLWFSNQQKSTHSAILCNSKSISKPSHNPNNLFIIFENYDLEYWSKKTIGMGIMTI